MNSDHDGVKDSDRCANEDGFIMNNGLFTGGHNSLQWSKCSLATFKKLIQWVSNCNLRTYEKLWACFSSKRFFPIEYRGI